MKLHFAIVYFLLIGLLANCSKSAEHQAPASDPAVLARGFQLLESNCFSCHSPDADFDSRIAPPMVAIKKHYIHRGTTRADFVKAVSMFVQNPTEEASLMPGAIKKFGLMPKLSFSAEDLAAIATYIYDTELEAPDWFEAHYQSEKGKYANQNTGQSPLELGAQYANATKATLGSRLLNAINTLGTAEAVAFCNTTALPLTDSMANVQNAYIRRVSDKPRNPKNLADEAALAFITSAKAQLAQGTTPKPQMTTINGVQRGYYPIVTNKMCLQCHGQPGSEIATATQDVIRQRYPKDRAVGYKENELRGIWVVEIKE